MGKYYVGVHSNPEVYKNSSSGGAFTAITDYLFDKYGFLNVFGCVFDRNLNAIHTNGTTIEERDLMRGSKYIASDLRDSFKKVFEKLKNNEYVVFSGSPCQIAGLKSYLDIRNINLDKLITVDFICHGVGSNRFFKDYIKHLETKYKSKAINCKFRGKTKPGKLQDMVVTFKNGKKYVSSTTSLDWFYSIYLKNLILRPSCYNCKFSTTKRISDLTIADDWSKDRNTQKAYSLIISNSKIGDEIVQGITNTMMIYKIDKNEINQPNIKSAAKKPSNYDEFWNIYQTKGYEEVQKYIGNNTMRKKMKVFIADIIDKLNLRKIAKKIKGELYERKK